MKYFIIGLHSTGKQEVVDHLEKMGIKCGRIFSNIEEPSEDIYNSRNYELYSNEDINTINPIFQTKKQRLRETKHLPK